MSAIPLLDDDHIDGHVAAVFTKARAAMGKVPNLFRVMANAPAVLDIYAGAKAAQPAWAALPLQDRIAKVMAGVEALIAMNDQIVPELAHTSTFKSQKVELRKQGYGPDIADPIYVLAGRDEGYVPFYDGYTDEVRDGKRPK